MGLAERRAALGYSQEGFAHAIGVNRTTVGRWERGETEPQASLRRRVAGALELDLAELDAQLAGITAPAPESPEPTGSPSGNERGSGTIDDMIRRQFLRTIAVTGALAAVPAEEAHALAEGVGRGATEDFLRMNGHLWQVYQLARSKSSVHPIVRDQLRSLNSALGAGPGRESRALCSAAGDLFQLAGELAFDANRYTDAAASYALAASVSRDARSFDLWSCSLVRQAYVDMADGHYGDAAEVLSAAERLAGRGDSSLSTRHWVASVQAEAYAGLGRLDACERALDEAEKVTDLDSHAHNGGWLRFDGSRLAEERGARYVQLGRLDLAETALLSALKQVELAQGQSFRRRGSVLTDLAAIGAKRGDPDEAVAFGRKALGLARESSSGYVVRRLHRLRGELGRLAHDGRVAELRAEIATLSAT